MKWIRTGVVLCIMVMLGFYTYPETAHASDSDIYKSLQDSIKNSWDKGMENLETNNEIEIKGNLPERILRSIANALYGNLVSIKAWSVVIGGLSFIMGIFISITAKLNKKLKRFAISFFVVTVPVLLFIFVFGTTKLISMFI